MSDGLSMVSGASEVIALASELAKDIGVLLSATDAEQERERLILMQRRIQAEIARRELPP